MAYMSQEQKSKIAAALKAVVPADWKYSLSVSHHSTIVMTIASAPVDLIAEMQIINDEWSANMGRAPRKLDGHVEVNPYHYEKSFGESVESIRAIFGCLNLDNYNNSDMQSDYFCVGHYVNLSIGRWNKAFVVTEPKAAKAA